MLYCFMEKVRAPHHISDKQLMLTLNLTIMAELNTKDIATTNKKRLSRKVAPKVDLTAMVDLAFLLITFFMLTTSLNKPNALDVAVPDKNQDSKVDMDERRIINLIVNEGTYKLIHGDMHKPIEIISDLSTKKYALKEQLQKMNTEINTITSGKNAIVLIKPTSNANTKSIIHSFDEIKSAGIKQYMLSKLDKKEESSLLSLSK